MKREYSSETFSGIKWKNEQVAGYLLEDCEFENCEFDGLSLQGCLFSGCVFRNCKLVGNRFQDCQAMNNLFEDCSLIGIDWAELIDERKRAMNFLPFEALVRCAVRHNVFFGMDMRRFDFSGCDLSGSYFDDCALPESKFCEAELQGTSFSHCNLTGADFRGARNYFFSLESNQVKKAKFSLPEAVNLLAAIGIVIEDLPS